MFRKPYQTKSNTQLKSSDRRKLKDRLQKVGFLPPDGSNVAEYQEMLEWWNTKCDYVVSKIQTADGNLMSVYSRNKVPLLLETKHDQTLIPTLYYAWKVPGCFKTLYIYEPTLEFLRNGADLMLPGVLSGLLPPDIASDQLVAVSLLSADGQTVTGPVAVGQTTMSSAQMLQSGMKGRGVRILHMTNDTLWMTGPKDAPPTVVMSSGTNSAALSAAETHTHNVHDENTGQSITNAKLDDEAAQVEEACSSHEHKEEESADSVLLRCFLAGVKYRVPRDCLPLDVGQLYVQCIAKCVPEGLRISMKHTTHKKFSVFLKYICDEYPALITLKNVAPGKDELTSVDWNHPALRKFELSDERVTDSVESAEVETNTVHDYYSLTAAVLPLTKVVRPALTKGDKISATELRTIINDYVRIKQLQRDKFVVLDDILQSVLMSRNKKYGLVDSIVWSELHDVISNTFTQCYRLTQADGTVQYKTGNRPNIIITVEQRASNKKVTLVNNLCVFGISVQQLATTVQHKMACSASVHNHDQLLVQGNQVAFIGQHLIDHYKVPRGCIKGLELAPKAKKNK